MLSHQFLEVEASKEPLNQGEQSTSLDQGNTDTVQLCLVMHDVTNRALLSHYLGRYNYVKDL